MARGSIGDYAHAAKTYLHNIMYGKEKHEWGVVVEAREQKEM
jgi:branched-chain amino acid aminotransferase